MAVAAAEFFAALGGSSYEPILHGATGRVRFDLVDERDVEHWLVTIEQGSVSVSKRNRRADCVVHVGRSLFERIADGEANAMAAILRGEMVLEGDAQLAVLFQRLFPSPPAARDRIRRDNATSP
jgi:putative sterol carrier protein